VTSHESRNGSAQAAVTSADVSLVARMKPLERRLRGKTDDACDKRGLLANDCRTYSRTGSRDQPRLIS
jgi:hypothetical protein